MQVLTLAALSLAVVSTAALLVQDAKPPRFTHPMPKDPQEGMARWMATCKPSAAHERLKELLGNYDVTMRMWMDQSKPPMESKGTAETSWLVEGKWLISKTSCDMMGQKVVNTSILGYDNFKQRYVWCAVDSLQTCMNTAFGHFDQSGDNLILWGTIDEPMTPEQDKQCKYVWRGFGKDKLVYEVHDMMIGETNTKVVEFEFTRRK